MAKKEAAEHTKRVEVDGLELDIDMRAVEDIRTLRLIAKVEKEGEEGVFAAVDLFDFVLGDQVEKVMDHLKDEEGFVPSTAYSTFCANVLKAVGAKN